jgi:hypothetical protein
VLGHHGQAAGDGGDVLIQIEVEVHRVDGVGGGLIVLSEDGLRRLLGSGRRLQKAASNGAARAAGYKGVGSGW